MSQAGIVDFEGANPQVPTTFDTDGNPAIPILNILEILGETVANGTNPKPVFTDGSGNTVTIEVQVAGESGLSDINNAGLASFDSSSFDVDADGFVTLTGGGSAITEIDVDAFTFPGTDPVLANSGTIIMTGAQVGSGVVGTNVIRTDSLAANTVTIEIQRSDVSVTPDVTLNGVSHFDSSKFTIDSMGFVSTNGTGIGNTITGNTGGALSPTAGNWNIVTANSTPKFVGLGSTLTLDFGIDNLILGNSATSITSASLNVGIGSSALTLMTSGGANVAVGSLAGAALTSGSNNVLLGLSAGLRITTASNCVAVGVSSLSHVTTGVNSNNIALGHLSLTNLVTGTRNIGIGVSCGSAYTGTESSNIVIENAGIIAESNTIRIGTTGSASGQQNRCFIAGIDGVNVGSVATVVTESGTQLGTAVLTPGTGISITPGANTITIAATGASLTDYHDSIYIVGSNASANYATIALAYAAAVAAGAPGTVFIQPGVYTENITLTAGINICAHTCDSSYVFHNTSNTDGAVIIRGKISGSYSGTVNISGIRIETSGDYALELTGGNFTYLVLKDCTLIGVANSIIHSTNNGGGQITCVNCTADLQTTGITHFILNPGNTEFRRCSFINTGGSTTASTQASGSTFESSYSGYAIPITASGDFESAYDTFSQTVTLNGAGSNILFHSEFSTATASCISVGGSASLSMVQTRLNSTNTNVITGAGSVSFANCSFTGSSSTINATTQVPYVASNDAIKVVTPAAYPYTTTAQDALIKVDTSSARTITPLASPTTGQKHIIKDTVGSAAANNITVTPSGKNIDGSASHVITTNYGSITIIYNGTEWSIV